MSVASGAAALVPGAGWLRLALKVAPYVAIVALGVALLLTRATLDRVRLQVKVDVAQGQRQAAERYAANAGRHAAAADSYAKRRDALQPLILRSKDTVTTYAQTPAGRAPCLAADRVHGIDGLDASLFDRPATGGGADAVSADPDSPPG